MKGAKWFAVLFFSGCLLLFTAIFFSSSAYEKIKGWNGPISMNKVGIRLNGNTIPSGGYLTPGEMGSFQRYLGTDVISYAAEDTSLISSDTNARKANIAGTDELAPMFEGVRMLEGSFFSEADCREKNQVVVIDEDTAWKLFNNDTVLGCTVDIFGRRFRITGVFQGDGSAFGKLASAGSIQAYIPVQTYLDIVKDGGISLIQFEPGPESIPGKGGEDAKSVLASMGRSPEEYTFTDYRVEGILMEQKPALLVFFMGLFVILSLLAYTLSYLKKTLREIRMDHGTNYLTQAVAVNRRNIVNALVLLVFAGLSTVIIWKLIKFRAYLSPDLIPTDFTDVSYYRNLFYQTAGSSLAPAISPVSFQELKFHAAGTTFNLIFCTGCFGGLLLFYAGILLLKNTGLIPERALLMCGGFLAADLVLFGLLSLLTGMPFVLNLKSILVFWLFLSANMLLVSGERAEYG